MRVISFGLILILATAGCSSTSGSQRAGGRVDNGVIDRPLRDVGAVREDIPDILKAAAEDPYALEGAADCGVLAEELAQLDAALGPDPYASDSRGRERNEAGELVSGALRGLVDLPYRGVIRWLSGAERRERAQTEAVLAGVARRAFLTGAARSADCNAAVQPPPSAAPAAPPAQPDQQANDPPPQP